MVFHVPHQSVIHLPDFFDFSELLNYVDTSEGETATDPDDPHPYFRINLHENEATCFADFLHLLRENALPAVAKHFGLRSITTDGASFTCNVYPEGAGLGPHRDVNSDGLSPGEFLTLILYAGKWDAGGDLVVHDNSDRFIVPVRPGSVVFLSSEAIHEAHPATGGTRVSCVAHLKVSI